MNSLRGKGDGKEKKQTSVFTKETFGVVLVLFATLILVCLITRGSVFSTPGEYINSFLFGCFGYLAFVITALALVTGVLMIIGKKTGLNAKRKGLLTLVVYLVALLVHVITMRGVKLGYGEYLTTSYLMAGVGGVTTCSGGGMVTAILAYPISLILSDIGSYVVLSILIAIVGYAFVADFSNGAKKSNRQKTEKFRSSYIKSNETAIPESETGLEVKDYPVEGVEFPDEKPAQKLFINDAAAFAFKTNREIKNEEKAPATKLAPNKVNGINVVNVAQPSSSYSSAYSSEMQQRLDYIKKPATIDLQKTLSENKSYGVSVSKPIPARGESPISPIVSISSQKPEEQTTPSIPLYEHDESADIKNDTAEAHAQSFSSSYAEIEDIEVDVNSPVEPVESFHPARDDSPISSSRRIESIIPFIEESVEPEIIETVEEEQTIEQDYVEQSTIEEPQEVVNEIDEFDEIEKIEEEQVPPSRITRSETRGVLFGDKEESIGFTSRVNADNNGRRSLFEDTPVASEPEPISESEPEPVKEPIPINREYFSPPLDILENHAQPINAGKENHQERMDIIRKTLEEFKINALPQSYIQGPSITRYEIMMPAGISVKSVTKYDDDLKMRLKAKDGVRIEAPIPGKDLVGIEVANTVKTMVGFRNVMEGLAQNPKKGSLVFAVGKDIVGNSISYDLAKGPHYLVAGATGSGKSVCLHVMIVSLLMRYSPEELKLVLVDPKSVEFRKYDHIPHLLVDEVITDAKRAITLLQWAYDETNRRNETFTEYAVSNIDEYNSQVASDTVAKLPRIVFVIDELADLMEACKKDLEEKIRKIAAKSRSAGIHLVLATQRPSVDVVTGTIKANLPSRIALRVMNYADSSTILGEGGAEKLLGNGDMLYKDSSMSNYERYQGAYISGREIAGVVNYIKENNKAYFDDAVKTYLENETKAKPEETETPRPTSDFGGDNMAVDELFLRALSLGVTSGSISISQLQRRFGIGYARAGSLVDKMERFGYVSGNEGSKARRVLLTKDEYESKYGNILD